MRKWYSLIDKVYALENLHQAFKHVKSNKGAPGIDKETVEDFALQLEKKLNEIHVELKTDTYEPDFHPSSYGYRPNRSCQKAIAKAEQFLRRYGFTHVVDMDLSKCFDTLDHELIIQVVNKKISDGRIFKLIRQFLTAGVLEDGAIQETEIGSP